MVDGAPAPAGPRRQGERLRLTWTSPLPPTRSGVADYAAEILPELAQWAEVTVVEPPTWRPPPEGGGWLNLPRAGAGVAVVEGTIELLHLGNNPYHLWVAERVRRREGIVVLHDPVLHHLLVEEAAASGSWDRFGEELEATYRGAGRSLAQARRWGYTGRLDPFLFPALAPFLSRAAAAIVHSRAAAEMVKQARPDLPVAKVPLAVACLARHDERQAWRARLGVAGNELMLLHLGFLTPAKGLDVILSALGALAQLGVACRVVVVGEGSGDETLARQARAAGLGGRLLSWGFATVEELAGLLAAADLGLVPRYPTAGETSAAVLRFLAASVPVVVAGYRQFLEFSPEAAFRIPPGRSGVADLVRHVATLAANPEALGRARLAARAAWHEGGHDPPRAAAALASALASMGLRP